MVIAVKIMLLQGKFLYYAENVQFCGLSKMSFYKKLFRRKKGKDDILTFDFKNDISLSHNSCPTGPFLVENNLKSIQ